MYNSTFEAKGVLRVRMSSSHSDERHVELSLKTLCRGRNGPNCHAQAMWLYCQQTRPITRKLDFVGYSSIAMPDTSRVCF